MSRMKTGTLAELNVKPGDVVQNYANPVMNGGVWIVRNIEGDQVLGVKDEYGPYHKGVPLSGSYIWRIVSRAPDPATPKLWLDMTREEKGALLLAHHEGKVIEYCDDGPWFACRGEPKWLDRNAYRVRPEPTRETVGLYIGKDRERFPLPIGTIDLLDGKPDLSSIKPETEA